MKRMFAAFGLCAVVLNGSAAENFAFAPYVEPNPVTMSVDSNTLVRLDRSQTVTIACADGPEQAVELAETRFGEWFRLTKTGWLFPSVNAPRIAAATFATTWVPYSPAGMTFWEGVRVRLPSALTVRSPFTVPSAFR